MLGEKRKKILLIMGNANCHKLNTFSISRIVLFCAKYNQIDSIDRTSDNKIFQNTTGTFLCEKNQHHISSKSSP